MIEPQTVLEVSPQQKGNFGKYRWTILSLVFFATTINYLDRQVISLLKDDYLTPVFHWTEKDYGHVVAIFQFAYALGMLGMGWVIDKVGTKLGYALALTVWSLAAIFTAAARNTFGFMIARGVLGVSEAGNFPSAIKTVAEWFPKKERALATGLFNSGSNIGAIIAPLTVPFIALTWGWEWAFIITGAFGLLWLIFWFAVYEIPVKHKKLSKSELEYINSDKDSIAENKSSQEKVKWIKLLTFRQTWAFLIGKFLTDPVWWFFLFWLPSFFSKQYGLKKTDLALPLVVIYTMTTFGSIFGGWLSGYLIKRGWPIYKARRVAMLIFALCVIPIVFTQYLGQFNYWYAVLITGFAASAHQAWSANIFTTASDMFPKKAVASITGIGGMAGAFGGMLIAEYSGALLEYYRILGHIDIGYYVLFIVCGSAYLLAWIIFNILAPKMKQVNFN